MTDTPVTVEEGTHLEREKDPGIPIFLWLLYIVLLGWGAYYLFTQLQMPTNSPYLNESVVATATAVAEAFVVPTSPPPTGGEPTTVPPVVAEPTTAPPVAGEPTTAPPVTGEPTAAPAGETPAATPAPAASGLPADDALAKGDPVKGQQIFATQACPACHQVTGTAQPVCPNLSAIGTQAPEIIQEAGYKGQATSGPQYLYESIVKPSAFVVTGFNDGVMPNNFATTLTEEQIFDIVAYLNTLKGG